MIKVMIMTLIMTLIMINNTSVARPPARPPAFFFQKKRTPQKRLMLIYKTNDTFMCFSKKTDKVCPPFSPPPHPTTLVPPQAK